MSDAMSNMDSCCKGCSRWKGSYANYPCNVCNKAFSGHPTSWYRTQEAIDEMNEELEGYDNVTKPKHYQLFNGEKEVLDLIEDRVSALVLSKRTTNFTNCYHYGNAIKYLMRWPLKNGVEDLRKCRQYLDMMIEELS